MNKDKARNVSKWVTKLLLLWVLWIALSLGVRTDLAPLPCSAAHCELQTRAQTSALSPAYAMTTSMLAVSAPQYDGCGCALLLCCMGMAVLLALSWQLLLCGGRRVYRVLTEAFVSHCIAPTPRPPQTCLFSH